MPDFKQVPLHRLLNQKEISSLFDEFEVLLPGYCLSLLGNDGKILAGYRNFAPTWINTTLEKVHDGQMITCDDDFIQPLAIESQIKGALVAHRIQRDVTPASNWEVQQVLSCIYRTLSLLLTKAIETRDVVNETIERYREINLLYHIGETIGTCLDPEQIPQLILQEAKRCIQVEAGTVLLIPENLPKNIDGSSGLKVKASIGAINHLKTLQQTSQQIVDKVVDTKQPAISINPFIPQHFEEVKDLFSGILCVPLLAGERTLGAIVLGRLSEKTIFTAGDMKLLMALAGQASIALETIRLHLGEIKKQRLEEELAISRQIQLSLLPDAPPSVPEWEFAALYQAAHQIGGDLYDFIQLPEQPNKLGLVIADVAGKGIPAALFMAFCRTIIRMEAMTDNSPVRVMERTNQLIIQDSRSHLFLTAFYAILDLQNGKLVYANGGHDPPFWFRAKKRECQELISHSKLLGLFNNIYLEERQIMIAPGDILVFYTDGITEARNSHGEFFGEERLESSIIANNEASAQDILQNILYATNEFIGNARQSDDFTLFVIKRTKERM